jgi:hypothetical protein
MSDSAHLEPPSSSSPSGGWRAANADSAVSVSPLSPLISSTRQALTVGADRVMASENSAVRFYNEQIATGANRQLQSARADLHHIRHSYGGRIVAGSALLAGVLSLPLGRYAAVRNGLLASLVSGWIVFPATVTGLVVAAGQQLQIAPTIDWTRKGEQTVRQLQTERENSTDSSVSHSIIAPAV